MLAGAGIRGGSVYGESDKQAAYVKSNPVTLEDFTATLFTAMNINPTSRLGRDGFTAPASTGNPIKALF
jgi:prolyl oligopeptidase PreP (S9A serine peptidase family)